MKKENTKDLSNPIISGYDQIKNTHRFNESLLKQAYLQGAEGNWSVVSGDKLVLAGSQTKQDWRDNFLRLPWNNVKNAERYSQLNKELENNDNIKQLVGHSLAGAVVLEKQKQHPDKFETVTYNAPIIPWLSYNSDQTSHRYRFKNDVISAFDKEATTFDKNTYNPVSAHSYKNQPAGYATNTTTSTGDQILIE